MFPFELFQILYCSENCRQTDWSHNHLCGKTHHVLSAEPISNADAQVVAEHEILLRLITFINIEIIVKTALQNRPMPVLKDKTTKVFHLNEITLEALLSLEDNFDKMSNEEKKMHCTVRI